MRRPLRRQTKPAADLPAAGSAPVDPEDPVIVDLRQKAEAALKLGNGINSLLVDLRIGMHSIGTRVDLLVQEQQALALRTGSENAEARESRRRLHDRVDDLVRESAETSATVKRLDPIVTKLEEGRQQGIGGQKLVGKVITVGRAAWLAVGAAATAIGGYLFHSPPGK